MGKAFHLKKKQTELSMIHENIKQKNILGTSDENWKHKVQMENNNYVGRHCHGNESFKVINNFFMTSEDNALKLKGMRSTLKSTLT